MNGETFLWILVYAIVGLIVLSCAAAAIAAAVKSAQSARYSAHLYVYGSDEESGQVEIRDATKGELNAFVNHWAPKIPRPSGLELDR